MGVNIISNNKRRSGELNILYNLGKSFNAVRDLSELLLQTVDAAVSFTDAQEGSLLLWDSESSQLVLQAVRHQEEDTAFVQREVANDQLAEYVLEHGEPLLFNPDENAGKQPGIAQIEQGLIYQPLITKDLVIGVLRLVKSPDRPIFDDHDLGLLNGLASYAAVAIENTRLYRQAVDTSMELQLLVESANALSWSLEMSEVLKAIARHMIRSLNTHWCIVSSWNPETRLLTRLAEYRSSFWSGEIAHHFDPYADPITQRALSNGKPLAVYLDEEDLSAADHISLASRGYKRILAVPIQRRGQIVGLAELPNVHSTERFTQAQIGASLHASLQLAALFDSVQDEQWDDQLRDLMQTLCRTAEADWCTLFVPDPDDIEGEYLRLAEYGSTTWVEENGPTQMVDSHKTLRIILDEQRVAVLHNMSNSLSEEDRQLFETAGPSTQLILPLVVNVKTVGLVQLYSLDPYRQFTSRELILARAMANQAAVALENAHLVRDLKASLEAQKTMQSQLVHAARLSALGELSAVIAHQINNPLTTILGDAWLLVEDLEPGTPSHESAEAILRAGDRAKKVVERVLNMARHEDQFQMLNVNRTINETIELTEAQITESGISIDVDLAAGLPPVRSIPGQLEDVWLNLLLNAEDAVKSRKERPRQIEVLSAFNEEAGMIEVQVRDNGRGIPESELEKIFDPYYTTKIRGKGTGLGLYICRQILSDHDGTITVTSEPGKGTAVTVQIPTALKEAKSKDKEWPISSS